MKSHDIMVASHMATTTNGNFLARGAIAITFSFSTTTLTAQVVATDSIVWDAKAQGSYGTPATGTAPGGAPITITSSNPSTGWYSNGGTGLSQRNNSPYTVPHGGNHTWMDGIYTITADPGYALKDIGTLSLTVPEANRGNANWTYTPWDGNWRFFDFRIDGVSVDPAMLASSAPEFSKTGFGDYHLFVPASAPGGYSPSLLLNVGDLTGVTTIAWQVDWQGPAYGQSTYTTVGLITNSEIIPEPSTMLLAMAGGGLTLFHRRRRPSA